MNKKIIAIVEVTTLILVTIGILSGCSFKNEKEGEDVITIIAPLNGPNQPKKDEGIEKAIEEITQENVNINWISKGSYKQKSTLLIASGEFPDILVVEDVTEDIVEGVNKGAFWNLTPYIDDYNNLKKADVDILNNASFKGETYGIYRYRDEIDGGIVLRKDWLDNLGLDVPKTIDEFTEVLRQFTFNDPDKNGLNDTYGLAIPGASEVGLNGVLEQMAIWFGAPNKWSVENGILIPDYLSEGYKDALDYIKKIYDDGLVNPKFYLDGTEDLEEKFSEAKYGSVIGEKILLNKIEKAVKEKNINRNSDEIIKIIATIQASGELRVLASDGYSGLLMIPKNAVETEEELKKILNFLDLLNSKEGNEILNYGIEGVNYEFDRGDYKELRHSTSYDLISFSEISMNVSKERSIKAKESKFQKDIVEIQSNYENYKVKNPVAPLKSLGYIRGEGDLLAKFDTINAKYIFGDFNKEQYESEVTKWLTSGGEKYIQNMNDLYIKFNS